MEMLTKDIQIKVSCCVPFANNIVLIDEIFIKINKKLELHRKRLEDR